MMRVSADSTADLDRKNRTILTGMPGQIRPPYKPFFPQNRAYFRLVSTPKGENTMSTHEDETDAAPSAEVIPLRPAKAKKASERKWGKAVMDFGFCIIPSLLLRGQARL